MPYRLDAYDLDELYGNPYEDNAEERLEAKRNKSLGGYRVKTVRSGNMLECEIYPINPVWDARAGLDRAPKMRKTRAAQRNLNRKNTVKNVVRLINANFTEEDVWATVTYDEAHLPATVEAAQVEMKKYLRRLKRYAEKNNLPPLKYLFVTEFEDDEKKQKKRVHHHLVCNIHDRDVVERLWHGGARRQARRLQPDEFGFEGLARYITKDPRGTKRYSASRNLVKPIIRTADSKITRGAVNKILRGVKDPQAVFERMYRGYTFNDISAFTSDYVSGAYLYVRMRRRQ